MKIKLFILTAALISGAACSVTSPAGAQESNGEIVPPKGEHPRLYIRKDEIPELRERMKTADGQKILAKMQKIAVDRTEEEEAAVTDHGFRYYFQMRGLTTAAQLDALDYLTEGNRHSARRAITSMLDSLQHTDFGTKQDLSRASGAMLMVGAVVYDWCYDQMTNAEKKAYIKELVRIAKTMECGYPPKKTEPIAGHSSEWMILRDMLSAGIAIYDEYPYMYEYAAGMILSDYVPVRNFIYSGHNYHQGTGYVTVRFTNDLISQWIFTKMGAGPIYSPEQQYVLYDFIYRRRPDGQVLPAGDVNPGRRSGIQSYALPAMFASSYYSDPYLAYEYERKPGGIENHCLLLELLWRDFNLKGKAPDDLPLSRYSGSPFGWMTARTAWDKNSVIAEMKINENFVGNHQHLDGGSFQIYYKGPLAIDSGAYQGASGGYNSPHNKNYFKRTIAHNSLLIYDPDEKFACWNYGGEGKTEFAANDGGQRMPGDRWDTCRSFENLLSESYTVGKALAHGFGPELQTPAYSYLKGDITKAYSSKVKDVKRSFVFLNLFDSTVPAALVVYDNVESSNASFGKYWLMHSIEEPEIGNGWFEIRRTKNNDSGMLHCDVILPDKASIENVGGEGKDFYVFGENFPNPALPNRPDEANERGAWRVEVRPSAPATKDNFLNVIQVADNGCKAFHKVYPVSGTDGTGAAVANGVVVADRAVIFNSSLGVFDGDFSFTIEGADNANGNGNKANSNGKSVYKILVTDLAEGKWSVKQDGRPAQVFTVKAEEGTVYFDGTDGSCTFTRIL